jgi:hypothetical protein
MKYFLLLLSFALSIVVSAQVSYYDSKDFKGDEQQGYAFRKRLADNHISGEKIYHYKSSSGADTAVGYLVTDISYDNKGQLSEHKVYKKNGSLRSRSVYQWNSDGKIIDNAYYKGNGKLLWRYVTQYDTNGNVTEQRSYWKNGEEIQWHSIATYDEIQNMTEMKWLEKNDTKLTRVYTYTYYPDGSKKQTIEYNGKGKVLHTWNFDCNPTGALETTAYKDSSKICIKYETDKDGNKIKVKEQNVKQGSIVRLVAKYDKNNNEIFSAGYDKHGKMKTHRESVFDSNNNQVEKIIYKPYSAEIKKRFVWHYDTAGFITEEIAYKESNTPYYTRKFSFYK